MNWFGAGIDGPMIVTRAVHFAATAIVAGALTFRGVVAVPALRAVPPACALIDRQVRGIVWINLLIAVVSGLAWVLLLTMSLSGENLGECVARADADLYSVKNALRIRDVRTVRT